jgi:hypothetical protein
MKVFVYFNLRKQCWSVKALQGPDRGKVIAHCTELTMIDCTFKVSEAGRQRVLRDKRKNVHAGVVGNLVALHDGYADPIDAPLHMVTYNPYRYSTFVRKHDELPVRAADRVFFCMKTVYARGLAVGSRPPTARATQGSTGRNGIGGFTCLPGGT